MSASETGTPDENETPAENELPIFRTEETRQKLMAIYDEGLRQWPVAFETFFVETRYGATHVIAAGDRAARALVMVHPAAVGGFVWSSIIAPLSEKRRVYALDTIGDIGRSELEDPDRYPKKGRDYSTWLDDVYAKLEISTADVVAGSMGGWIAMNHAIHAPNQVRRLVLLGPMGLSPWRANLGVLIPFAWYLMRPSNAKLERIIFRSLGEGERVNREFQPWMLLMAKCKPKTGQPFHLSSRKLRQIKAPTLVILGGKDGLVGSAAAAAKRARNIPECQVEILPSAGHIMSVDDPEFVGSRIVNFLEAEKT
jgi:pimeloyl-ACP methyl ester carboxylesterase